MVVSQNKKLQRIFDLKHLSFSYLLTVIVHANRNGNQLCIFRDFLIECIGNKFTHFLAKVSFTS